MITEELEFAISQYVDGTLPPTERAALELRLEGDPDARALVEEYRRLDASLKTELPTAPELDWDRLAAHLSANLVDEPLPRERTLAMPWVRRQVAPLAVAASLIVGTALAAVVVLRGGDDDPVVEVAGNDAGGRPTVAVIEIAGPEAAPADAQVARVEIGPSPQFAAQQWRFRAAEAVVTRPSRVVWIATGAEPAQDGRQLPY